MQVLQVMFFFFFSILVKPLLHVFNFSLTTSNVFSKSWKNLRDPWWRTYVSTFFFLTSLQGNQWKEAFLSQVYFPVLVSFQSCCVVNFIMNYYMTLCFDLTVKKQHLKRPVFRIFNLVKTKIYLIVYFVSSADVSSACFRDYAAIVFFANNRFETGKRKLQYLTFQDFAFCAGQLISNWTVGAVGELF